MKQQSSLRIDFGNFEDIEESKAIRREIEDIYLRLKVVFEEEPFILESFLEVRDNYHLKCTIIRIELFKELETGIKDFGFYEMLRNFFECYNAELETDWQPDKHIGVYVKLHKIY